MGYPDNFEGFMINDQKKWSDFKKQTFQPKKFEDRDIDIQIEACGVCGSDVHTITGGWGECPLPICVGHEVIGKAVKVGDKVKDIKVGDRVGVGAQIASCLECRLCKTDQENYCPHKVDTYGAPYPDGTIAQGGFASHIRAHEYFTFPIPKDIPIEMAAPMLCAGITTYSPLYRAKIGPGKKVAILGIGGLGHYGILWAAAMGAEVTALSHSPSKKDDAIKLGAKHFVVTGEKDWHKDHQFEYDFILNCADMTHTFNLQDYMSTVNINGDFHNVGLPDEPLPEMMAQMFASNGAKLTGSHIGNRPEMLAMFKLASEKKLKPIIETLQVSEEGCKEAVERVKENKVRYRFTLTGFEKAFPDNRV